ncbi:MAG TPA: matrixin family metalloprotease, partial [Thermoanaerobaculia bacterium]
MTSKLFRAYWLTCISMIFAAAASATTIILPTDAQLIAKSPVIVAGTVLRSNPVAIGDKIWTETTLEIDRTFKGGIAGEITIRELGGVIDDRLTKIFGAPEYMPGECVLAFLTPTPRGDFQTIDLYVGKFSEQRTLSGSRIWKRDDVTADVALVDRDFKPIEARNVQREAVGFEQYVIDRVAGGEGSINYGVENPLLESDITTASGRIAPEFTLISEPSIYRWFAFDRGNTVRWYSYGTQTGYTGGGVNEISTAMSAWTGYASALIRYSYAGAGSGSPSPSSQTNGINEIEFNDPLQEISGSWNPRTGGVVGVGGFNGVSNGGNWTSTFTADSSHTQGTFRAFEITEAFLAIQDGVAPTAGIPSSELAEIVAHEFGHTLGLGHSTDSTALMYPSVTGLGASLRADDQVAARWLYPSGSAPAPPPTVTVPVA